MNENYTSLTNNDKEYVLGYTIVVILSFTMSVTAVLTSSKTLNKVTKFEILNQRIDYWPLQYCIIAENEFSISTTSFIIIFL